MTDAAFEKALMSTKVIAITTTGRISGRAISHPVWFVRQGEKLYPLPVGDRTVTGNRNGLKTPKIRLAADGKKYSARATPITDAAKVHAVVENFRAKYGAGDVRANYPKLDVARRGGARVPPRVPRCPVCPDATAPSPQCGR